MGARFTRTGESSGFIHPLGNGLVEAPLGGRERKSSPEGNCREELGVGAQHSSTGLFTTPTPPRTSGAHGSGREPGWAATAQEGVGAPLHSRGELPDGDPWGETKPNSLSLRPNGSLFTRRRAHQTGAAPGDTFIVNGAFVGTEGGGENSIGPPQPPWVEQKPPCTAPTGQDGPWGLDWGL